MSSFSKKIFFIIIGLIIIVLLLVGGLFGVSLHKHLQNECLNQEPNKRLSEDCTDVF